MIIQYYQVHMKAILQHNKHYLNLLCCQDISHHHSVRVLILLNLLFLLILLFILLQIIIILVMNLNYYCWKRYLKYQIIYQYETKHENILLIVSNEEKSKKGQKYFLDKLINVSGSILMPFNFYQMICIYLQFWD